MRKSPLAGTTSCVFSLPKVFAMRDSLTFDLMAKVGGRVCGPDELEQIVDRVAVAFPKVPREVLVESTRCLAGMKLDRQPVAAYAWRLAGNADRIKAFHPVYPVTRPPFDEWVPAQVVSASRSKNPSTNKPGWSMVFQILAGRCCPARTFKFWTDGLCAVIAKSMGFATRPPGENSEKPARRIYGSGRELTTMRLLVLLDAAKSQDGRISFEKTDVSPSLVDWNKTQLDCRDRVGHVCPGNYPNSFPCGQCPVGYVTCRAATHPRTYVKGYCHVCGKDSWFDPPAADDRCVACHESR